MGSDRHGSAWRIASLAVVAGLALSAYADPSYQPPSQQLYVYPAHGQSYEQQQKDQYQCYEFAKGQTGFDPMAPPPPTSPPPQQHKAGFFGGALIGSLVGVTIGAIAHDPDEGAEIGAASGGLFGGMRSQQSRNQQEQWQQQQAATLANDRSNYNRAYSACLEGRGYSVD